MAKFKVVDANDNVLVYCSSKGEAYTKRDYKAKCAGISPSNYHVKPVTEDDEAELFWRGFERSMDRYNKIAG